MGWLGVVFKEDISRVSDYLAVGLTTGYLGSLTTFSGWNQKMLDLSVNGKWLLSFWGFLLGLALPALSIVLGVWTAKGFKWLIRLRRTDSSPQNNWQVNSLKRHLAVMLVMTIKKAVNTKRSDTIASGIQLGLMGCLSTVSTFIAEFYKMHKSRQPWQAYAYAAATIATSFGLGVVIYNGPVWTQGYK